MSGWHYGVKGNGWTAAEESGEWRCRRQLWASWESRPASNIVGINTLQFPTIWKDLIEDRQINPGILPGDQHLSFSENAVWNTWSGINRVGVQSTPWWPMGTGCWRARWNVMTSRHKAAAILDLVVWWRWADTFLFGSVCGRDPSLRLDRSVPHLSDVSVHHPSLVLCPNLFTCAHTSLTTPACVDYED